MLLSLQNANLNTSTKVCHQHNDSFPLSLYPANMAKRARPILKVRWYLREWMDFLKVRQAYMVEQAGWSKTTASLLYNCQQDYNPDLVEQAAHALKIAEFELLMPPERAMALRRVQENSIKLAVQSDPGFTPPQDLSEDPVRKKAATRK